MSSSNTIAKSNASRLFKPVKVGNIELKHRIALAPLTRFRATEEHDPTLPLVPEYYAQRASAPGTLLITEATLITPRAGGYARVPGIWDQSHIDAWKAVTDAVHEKGSFIFLQLWALGRVAPLEGLRKEAGPEATVVSAGDIPPSGDAYTKPRPLTVEEIKGWVEDYVQAARNAVAAGFDGVEIHGANGYLIDQFTQDVSNNRTDAYGGSIENRSRFGLEVAKAVTDAIGPERVGYRISPLSTFQDMRMDEPRPQFTHLVTGLSQLKLAYLHVTESWRDDAGAKPDYKFIFDAWATTEHDRPLVLCGGFTPEAAFQTVDETHADKQIVIAVGRSFLATPDYVDRVRAGIALNAHDRSTFYWTKEVGPLERGYTDYPFSTELQAVKA